MRPKQNEFSATTRKLLAQQAAHICSNPNCEAPTSGADEAGTAAVSIGRAAHIHAASPNGARFDASLTPDEVSSPDNGIWLCAVCADLVDKHDGSSYPADLLRTWKARRLELSAASVGKPPVSEVGGAYVAHGAGEVTGLHVTRRNVRITPGTTATATGIGKITGAKFE